MCHPSKKAGRHGGLCFGLMSVSCCYRPVFYIVNFSSSRSPVVLDVFPTIVFVQCTWFLQIWIYVHNTSAVFSVYLGRLLARCQSSLDLLWLPRNSKFCDIQSPQMLEFYHVCSFWKSDFHIWPNRMARSLFLVVLRLRFNFHNLSELFSSLHFCSSASAMSIPDLFITVSITGND